MKHVTIQVLLEMLLNYITCKLTVNDQFTGCMLNSTIPNSSLKTKRETSPSASGTSSSDDLHCCIAQLNLPPLTIMVTFPMIQLYVGGIFSTLFIMCVDGMGVFLGNKKGCDELIHPGSNYNI